MTITEITVAAADKRMIKREKDFCRLKATRRAINWATFKIKRYKLFLIKPKTGLQRLPQQINTPKIMGGR